MTYVNTCDASAAGVNVVSNGECRNDGKGKSCLFGDLLALVTISARLQMEITVNAAAIFIAGASQSQKLTIHQSVDAI